MYKIKHIPVFRNAVILTFWELFVLIVLFLVEIIFLGPFLPDEFPLLSVVAGAGAIMIVLFPILFGVFFLVMNILALALYNVVARITGGISLSLSKEGESQVWENQYDEPSGK